MISSPKPPAAPDPAKTAAAQTNMNVASGVVSNINNMINQQTPDGSLTYSRNANDVTWKGPDGKTYVIPQFTATQSLSPAQQQLYDKGNQTQQNIADIGVDQSGKIGQLLSTPLDLSSTAIDDNLYSRYSPRVLAQQSRDDDAMNSQLAAEGITRGSAAWDDAMRTRDQSKNDQWNQLYLGGRQSAIGEMLQQRQEPINEINALMSGSQVSNPVFGSTPQSAIKPADYEGDVYNSYNAQMQSYQAQLNSNNAMMGGIFGALGTIGGGWARSDRRLKTDISPIGQDANGLTRYVFRFHNGDEWHVGYMADEVAKLYPSAVATDAYGFDLVNYEALR